DDRAQSRSGPRRRPRDVPVLRLDLQDRGRLPVCIVVWTVTIPMFVAVTAHNVLSGAFGTRAEANPFARVFAKENIALSVLWMLIIFACIVVQFWSFFSNLV